MCNPRFALSNSLNAEFGNLDVGNNGEVMRIRNCVLIAAFVTAIGASPSLAADASIITVRKDCTGADNCFTALAGGVTSAFGLASQTNPITLDVGPGEWDEDFLCPTGKGWVHTRGAGRDSTIIKGGASGGFTAQLLNCNNVEFSNLTMTSDIGWTVEWDHAAGGGGSSTWTNVNLIAEAGSISAWYDKTCGILPGTSATDPRAVHFFFGSRLIKRGDDALIGQAYPSSAASITCSEIWYYGGEIIWDFDEDGIANTKSAAVILARGSMFQGFGISIRAVSRGVATDTRKLVAVRVIDGPFNGIGTGDAPSFFHLHGGIIAAVVTDASSTMRLRCSSSGAP